ncbi:cysteine hydrolase [Apilactobacillus timberlakei]|uniref:cysteine hydrolase family protein n=1 Tax=Apilactobacillus timberlakei TaxID=2008380 RepID=UPI00112A9A8D|nr:isochorismatase family cysteine hydrolase [Apilactobacillus timberlakei]TPR19595.1 cysteine hydrolase [Apilactobacillus timberlakei]TPR20572.1 cysteine hydrolase [Apilactobacillus timberlakei]TPR22616.1 cysteine hydrolase [Apilactobacillus timberlakei]
MAKEALLIIDYTNDFVDNKGALTVGKPGQLLENSIINLANQFVEKDNWVILPTDLHKKDNPYHPETKLFPPHNLANTWGHEFYGKLQPWYDQHQDDAQVYMYDKTRYSAFAGTDLDLRLRERNIKTIHLVGVCTDICVLHTAIDAYNLNYNITIHENGVAATSKAAQEFSLNHFKNILGAKIDS